jgi:hypothetical protein
MGARSQTPFIPLTKIWALLGLLCGIPVFLGFAAAGHADKGLVANLSIGGWILVFRASWNLRHRPWFWPILCMMAFLHIFAVGIVQFPRLRLAIVSLAPFFILDVAAMYSIFWFAERWSGQRALKKTREIQ